MLMAYPATQSRRYPRRSLSGALWPFKAWALSTALAAALLIPPPANAQNQVLPTCTDLLALTAAATPDGAANSAPPLPPGAESCQRSLQLGGAHSLHCAWAFPYRSAAATEAFATLDTRLRSCLSARPAKSARQPVNHPDSFHQREYDTVKTSLSLALKDKAALNRTYLFLGVTTTRRGRTKD